MTNLAEIADKQLNDPLYLKAVTELGDDHPLETTQDIYSDTGIKLVKGGARFNSALYDKLLRHKLSPPLDQCLSVENAVTTAQLSECGKEQLQQNGWLLPLRTAIPDSHVFERILASIPLNPGVAFKLTLMREKRPELFRHSIYLALTSIYIGVRHGLPEAALVKLATAALLHDIGILHIDPALLEREHVLSDTERRHLFAHPLTAWMILKEYPEYQQDVLDAVMQHHERLDGSGYPLGLQGDAIGLFGRILAVAEIVASRHGDPNSAFEKMRLEAILKLNSRRYGRQLIGYLDIFYRDQSEVPACVNIHKQSIRLLLECMLTAITQWERLWEGRYPGYTNFDTIHNRIQSLKLEMLDTGLAAPEKLEELAGIDESHRLCFEVLIILDELFWQLRGIMDEIRRRWPDIDRESPNSCATQIHGWLIETDKNIRQARLNFPSLKNSIE